MGNVSFKATIDPTSVGAALMNARLVDLRPAWTEIAAILAEDQRRTFDTRGGNIGERWEPPSAATLARKGRAKGSAQLVLSGEVLAQVSSPSAGLRRASRTFMSFGTNIRHGIVQHFGSKARNIPARPFMRISDSAARSIDAIIRRAVDAEVERTSQKIAGLTRRGA